MLTVPSGAGVLPDLVPGVEVDGGGGEGELLVPGQEGGLQGPALLGRVGVPGAPVVLPLPHHRVPDHGCQLGINILHSQFQKNTGSLLNTKLDLFRAWY